MSCKSPLTFIVEWHNDKSKTWSGTPLSLFNALQYHFNIKEYDIAPKPSRLQNLICRFFPKPYDFGIAAYKKIRKRYYKKASKEPEHKILQFAEVIFDTPNIKTYIYIDLCVEYMKSLYESCKSLYDLSSFDFVSYKYIFLREPIQTKYLAECSGIFTMNKWLKQYLITDLGLPENKIFHVGGGINIDPSKIDQTKKTGNKFLFIGRDYIRKGLMLLYNAFCDLKKRYPNIELHIAGPEVNPIEDMISGCYFWGDCNKDEISNLYNKCDVFCMPSYFEAYGIVFIEALTYGLPCIGRDAFEMPYLIDDGFSGRLLKNEDVNELSNIMEEVLVNDKYRNNVLSMQEWYLNEYSWENVARRMAEIIKK